MSCIAPPELENKQLLAYLDGEANDQTAAHLAQCSYCRGRAEDLAYAQNLLTAQLYRLTCPAPTDLGQYQLQLLPAAQMDAIRQHLAGCPHCSRELEQLQGYLHQLSPDLELNFLERARVLVARLIPEASGGGPGLTPAFSQRGGEAGPYLYETGNLQIAIEVQDDEDRPGRKSLLGLVTGLETGGLSAQLWQAEQRIATTDVDDLSTFRISNIAPGRYDLTLLGPEIEVHVQDVVA